MVYNWRDTLPLWFHLMHSNFMCVLGELGFVSWGIRNQLVQIRDRKIFHKSTQSYQPIFFIIHKIVPDSNIVLHIIT